jgi:hypothetical protein
MTDVADEIRRAVGTTRPKTDDAEEAFRKTRAEARGALIKAHYELAGEAWGWTVNDDRVLDIVDRWLHQKAGR